MEEEAEISTSSGSARIIGRRRMTHGATCLTKSSRRPRAAAGAKAVAAAAEAAAAEGEGAAVAVAAEEEEAM